MKRLLRAILVLCQFAANLCAAEKPNILIILTDDQRADCIGAVNPRIHTPNIDRLATQGVLFNNCYISGGMSPAVCTSSRAMLMAGRNLFHLPKDISGKGNRPSLPVMSTVFRDAGYDTLYCGKHGNTYRPADNSFDKSVFISHRDTPNPIAERHSYTSHIVNYLADPARRKKPFFIFYAPPIPHDPLIPEPEDLARYRGRNLPPLPPNAAVSHAAIAGFNLKDTNVRPYIVPGMGKFNAPLNLAQWREVLARYYADVTSFDRQVGLIMAALERSGAAQNTLIVFSSDNGHSLSDHGLIHKQSVYEHDIRVPLIICGPGIPAGARSEALVDVADLFPTLCEWLQIPIPRTVEMQSFLPSLTDPAKPHRSTLYHAYREEMRAYRDDRYKIILFENGQVRLFDLQEDPNEMHDLSKASAQKSRLEEMMTKARQTAKDLDDNPKNMPLAFVQKSKDKGGLAPFWEKFDTNRRKETTGSSR